MASGLEVPQPRSSTWSHRLLEGGAATRHIHLCLAKRLLPGTYIGTSISNLCVCIHVFERVIFLKAIYLGRAMETSELINGASSLRIRQRHVLLLLKTQELYCALC